MRVLVTGGAGYIGSHCVRQLTRRGDHVVVYDNLSTGHQRLLMGEPFVHGDTRNVDQVRKALEEHKIEAVMHFAASCYVGESVTDPAKYYDNNLVGTMRLLQGMREAGVSQFIFSSSCATYGDPIRLPLDETHPLNPVNPYGYTKRAVEAMLSDYSRAYNLRYVSFRYFNAAGADPEGKLGECHDPETHLIPLILQVASGRRASVSIFGTDYETRDGTCIRDYIHIDDIAAAHLKGLDYLATGGESNVFNIGSETGYTVREVIEATERVTGKTITVEEGPRRPGDPPSLVASSAKIRDTLGWRPSYATLDDIIQTAWAWEQKEAARHT